jgi:hypothetical protein
VVVGSSRNSASLATNSPSPLADVAPSEPRITDYDRSHLATYLRLLDAAGEGAPWDEVARVVLGLDPSHDTEGARRIHDSHLARARWISDHGYRDLLQRTS